MGAKRVGKYGMAHHTIRYWQQQAKLLRSLTGHYSGRTALENDAHWQSMSARDCGHLIIGLAYVASREHLIASLTRTRRGRWLL